MGRPRPTSFGGAHMLSDCRVSAALPVSDLAQARSFYVDTLGLTPLIEGEDVLAFRCADGTDFGVFVSQGQRSGTPHLDDLLLPEPRRGDGPTCGRTA
jgi:catechol 2,3-dioxygenase-like lactoylglutathione lyase family enzyme